MPESLRVVCSHIVHTPLVRVLASRLILEERQKKVLAQSRVRVEEYWPTREDNIDGVHILDNADSAQRIKRDLTVNLRHRWKFL